MEVEISLRITCLFKVGTNTFRTTQNDQFKLILNNQGTLLMWRLRAKKGFYKSSRPRVTHPNTQPISQVMNHRREGASWGLCDGGLLPSASQLLPGLGLPELLSVQEKLEIQTFVRGPSKTHLQDISGPGAARLHALSQTEPGFPPAILRPLEITSYYTIVMKSNGREGARAPTTVGRLS